MTPWMLVLLPPAVFLAWLSYRQFKKSGKVSNLIFAQMGAFAAVYLLLGLLELRGWVTGRAMDYLSLVLIVLFVVVGSAMTGAAMRKAEEKKKKMVGGKSSFKQSAAKKAGHQAALKPAARQPAVKKLAAKNKKRKG
ncbi:MAG: hypothetical protein KGZ57_03835 [Dethiobacter sp.]|nr:hypothetical protein [Dethiobacter sp.]MCL5981304.1 hypothetical protein [Bacillota bacterium]